MVVTGMGIAMGVLGPSPSSITAGCDTGPQFPPLENGATASSCWMGCERRQRTWGPMKQTMWVLFYLKCDQGWIFPETTSQFPISPDLGLLSKDGPFGTGRFF